MCRIHIWMVSLKDKILYDFSICKEYWLKKLKKLECVRCRILFFLCKVFLIKRTLISFYVSLNPVIYKIVQTPFIWIFPVNGVV